MRRLAIAATRPATGPRVPDIRPGVVLIAGNRLPVCFPGRALETAVLPFAVLPFGMLAATGVAAPLLSFAELPAGMLAAVLLASVLLASVLAAALPLASGRGAAAGRTRPLT